MTYSTLDLERRASRRTFRRSPVQARCEAGHLTVIQPETADFPRRCPFAGCESRPVAR